MPKPGPKGKKRARSPESEQQPARPKKKTKTRKRPMTMKTGANQHKLKMETQLEPAAQGIMMLMWVWVRFLWDLLDTKRLPRLPSQEVHEDFNARFIDYPQVLEHFRTSQTAQAFVDVQKWRTAKARATGNYEAMVARIPDNVIQYLSLIMERFGLTDWQPDFRQDAYSTYNNTMRFIALDTLKQAIALLAFRHTGLATPAEHLDDLGLLVRMYDHIVHHYFYELWRREERRPGALARARQQAVNLKHNIDVAKQREEWMKTAGYPRRIRRAVATPETVSDTERKTIEHAGRRTETVWERKEMVGRGRTAQALAHHVDDSIFTDRLGKKRGNPGFRRVDPPAPVAGRGILPEDVPIDYYDSDFFNSRSIVWRGKWNSGRNRMPVFPAKAAELVEEDDVADFRTLNDRAWEQAHGDELREPYKIPTVAQMSNRDEDEDEDEDEEMDLDGEEGSTARVQGDRRHQSGQQAFISQTDAAGTVPGASGSGGSSGSGS